MHLVKDENGNVCPHSHEHTHHHEHSHHHSHEHSQGEGHGSECKNCNPADKNAALLGYMLQHNQSHAAELDQLAETMRIAGRADVAEQIKKAVDEFQKGNLYLGVALAMVKEKS